MTLVGLTSFFCIFVSVPYDDNHISLSSELFSSPETNFVNASKIVFPNCPQVFIAAQAPKEASFQHFWHMVIQEEVRSTMVTI